MILALCLAAFTGAAPVHTSTYTDLDNDCSDVADEKDFPQGSDIPMTCKGPDGWAMYETYSAYDNYRHITKDGEWAAPISTGDDVDCLRASYPSRKIEWRLRNGRPIALIVRVSCHDEHGGTAEFSPARGEYLVVQPLRKGALPIAIDAKRNRKANEEARKKADALP